MKIASFNVENFFSRAKVFDQDKDVSTKILDASSKLNSLFEKTNYSAGDKDKMISLIIELGMLKSDNGPFALLRKIRGKLLKRTKNPDSLKIVANGRADWVGWVELVTAPVNEIAIVNTARVIRDVNADIFGVVEAENRIVLEQFSNYFLKSINGQPYEHIMLIDGNDERGIDVALMTRAGYNIGLMQSHIDDKNSDGTKIFSRDCPEYCVTSSEGEEIWVLPNHLKSKFGGNSAESQNKRRIQSEKVAEIYNRLVSEGKTNIVILGDFNDTPDSPALQPLLAGTDLRDVSDHPAFDTGEYAGMGTYGLGNDNQKIDYLLLSPALFARVTKCGLFRKGAWPGKKPARWSIYPEIKNETHVASDHHVIWCEIN